MKTDKSFSLIEVLVFVTIISIFFVMAVAATTVAVRNMKYNEHKIIASHYARQLEEWLRAEKEIDWNSFTGNIGTHCFNDIIISWPGTSPCPPPALNGLTPPIFDRELILSWDVNPIQVTASITVSWNDLGRNYSITENTVFDVLEQP